MLLVMESWKKEDWNGVWWPDNFTNFHEIRTYSLNGIIFYGLKCRLFTLRLWNNTVAAPGSGEKRGNMWKVLRKVHSLSLLLFWKHFLREHLWEHSVCTTFLTHKIMSFPLVGAWSTPDEKEGVFLKFFRWNRTQSWTLSYLTLDCQRSVCQFFSWRVICLFWCPKLCDFYCWCSIWNHPTPIITLCLLSQ